METYSGRFFRIQKSGSRTSAESTVPIILEYVTPRSIVDFGCGTTTWLSVFSEHGVTDVIGVDGDYVDRNQLEIPQERYVSWDLEQPFEVEREFDLAISLEVGEHLSPNGGFSLVEALTAAAPVVLFSAAIPHQGGTNHVNEQWPEYWISLFTDHGFVCVDAVRERIWKNINVSWWYSQNMFFFVSEKSLNKFALLKSVHDRQYGVLPLVHPRHYEQLFEATTIRGAIVSNLRTQFREKCPPPARRVLRQILKKS